MFVSALFLTLYWSANTNGQIQFQELTGQLSPKVEWIDRYGSQNLSKQEVTRQLNRMISDLSNPTYSLKHNSHWKRDQCYQIIHVTSDDEGYRLFFQCVKNRKGQTLVTKIKVTALAP